VIRPDWDEYFLGIAHAVSARGECTRSQVGAVIVRDRRIVSTGYNGVEAGEPSCLDGICPRANVVERHLPYDDSRGLCIAVHAEDNAIRDALNRLLSIRGGRIYVTKEPCERCAALIDQHDLSAVWPSS
jgi:dCMP deaminase